MKHTHRLNAIIFLCLCLAFSFKAEAQNGVTITELKEKKQSDPSLGDVSVAVFLMKNDDILISSSNNNDRVSAHEKQEDGMWRVEVYCDVSNQSVEKSRNFNALIKNTSLKGDCKKTIEKGTRYFFQVSKDEYVLRFDYPSEKNILYAVAKKSCVEFSIPDNIKGLNVIYSDNIGANVKKTSKLGLQVMEVEIDCEKLSNVLSSIETAKKLIKEKKESLEQLTNEITANSQNDSYDVEGAEAREKELQKEIAREELNIPTFYIGLRGKNTAPTYVDNEKMLGLVNPKNRLHVSVNDIVGRQVVYQKEEEPISNFIAGVGFNVMPMLGPTASVGFDFKHFNVELGGTFGLSKSSDIYIYDKGGTLKDAYSYKPMRLFLRAGYDLKVARIFSITPQVGAAFNIIKGTRLDGVEEAENLLDGANAISATVGLRLMFAPFGRMFRLHVTPEYDIAVKKDNNFKALSEFDSKIKQWGSGLNINMGILLYF